MGISLPVHNRLDELEATLESLSDQLTGGDRVCLVDNASEDQSGIDRLMKCFYSFHWIQNAENTGFGAAHHQALAWLQEEDCQYMLLLNPDLRLPPGALDQLIEASGECADRWVLGPLLVRSIDEDPVIDSAGLELDFLYRARDRFQGRRLSETPLENPDSKLPESVTALCGAVLFIPSRLLPLRPEAPVFSTDYFAYFEDIELGLELAQRDVSMGLIKDLRFVHRRGGFGRLREVAGSDWKEQREVVSGVLLNRYRTLFRHEGLWGGILKRPRLLPYEAIRWSYLMFRKPYLRSLFPEVVRVWREERDRRIRPPVRRPG